MEEVPGIQLEQVWPKMSIHDRSIIVKSIVGFQKAWTSISFTRYGSLYFSNDLKDTAGSQSLYTDANGNQVTNERFNVGPSTSRENFDSGRGAINFDRGPCQYAIEKDKHHLIKGRELFTRLSPRNWPPRTGVRQRAFRAPQISDNLMRSRNLPTNQREETQSFALLPRLRELSAHCTILSRIAKIRGFMPHSNFNTRRSTCFCC